MALAYPEDLKVFEIKNYVIRIYVIKNIFSKLMWSEKNPSHQIVISVSDLQNVINCLQKQQVP